MSRSHQRAAPAATASAPAAQQAPAEGTSGNAAAAQNSRASSGSATPTLDAADMVFTRREVTGQGSGPDMVFTEDEVNGRPAPAPPPMPDWAMAPSAAPAAMDPAEAQRLRAAGLPTDLHTYDHGLDPTRCIDPAAARRAVAPPPPLTLPARPAGPSMSQGRPGEAQTLSSDDRQMMRAGMMPRAPELTALDSLRSGGPTNAATQLVRGVTNQPMNTTEINRTSAMTAPMDGMMSANPAHVAAPDLSTRHAAPR